MIRDAIRLLLCAALFVSVGCGGDVNETHEGTLEEGDEVQSTDGSWQDIYEFSTKEGYHIDIQMNSPAFNTYLMLSGPDGTKIAEEDGGGEGTNARIRAVAPTKGTYVVYANSNSAGETGAYTLTIRASETAPQ